jgi:hypothetical protein
MKDCKRELVNNLSRLICSPRKIDSNARICGTEKGGSPQSFSCYFDFPCPSPLLNIYSSSIRCEESGPITDLTPTDWSHPIKIIRNKSLHVQVYSNSAHSPPLAQKLKIVSQAT